MDLHVKENGSSSPDYDGQEDESDKDVSNSESDQISHSLLTEKKNSKREKGPPIVCLTCKTVWTKNRRGGRLFMFGGSRPFMTKFEAKFRALMGKEELRALQEKSATKFGRSYICRECYLLVRQAYDNIRKIQRDVAKSIQRVKSKHLSKSNSVLESENSGSDLDLDIDYQAQLPTKKKLSSVAERLAEKIASLTLVKINNRTPKIQLTPLSSEFLSNYQSTSKNLDIQITSPRNDEVKLLSLVSPPNQGNEWRINVAITSSTVGNNTGVESKLYEEDGSIVDRVECCNKESSSKVDAQKISQSELDEILANPLLLIKSSQPLKLAEIKNNQAFICGEGNCDWLFSSRFFWENHIRHYHRSGKPFLCTFEGCGRSFTGKSKLELHLRSHTDERPFICDKCGNGFRGNQELKAHRLTHTSEKPYQCLKCDKNFKLQSSLKRHLQYHDGGNFPFPCTYPECGKAFKSKYDLKCHNRLHTGEKPYKCTEPGCNMAFRIPCQFTMHKRSHTGERPFKCNIENCSASFISSNALQAHLLCHTSERPFCCEFCGKTFKHKMLYRMHLKKHSNPHKYSCSVEGCGEDFSDRKLLNQHLMSQHAIQDCRSANKKVLEYTEDVLCSTDGSFLPLKSKTPNEGSMNLDEEQELRQLSCPYDKCQREYEEADDLNDHLVKAHMPIPREKMCHLCGIAYQHKQQLEHHLSSLHDDSPTSNEHMKGIFVCHSERCGLRFHRLEELKHHVTWHLGNPPYQCEFSGCSRTFLLETMCNQHIKEHENLKYFTCSFDSCTEGFTSYLKVLKHSKVHYGFFRCPVDGCNKAIQTLSSARMHLLRHEKPFVCLMCGKRFASNQRWNKHKRSHTGEKIFECKICSSQFPDPASLKIHKQVHKGDKQYICEECGQQFNSQALRRVHMKTHSREFPYLCSKENCGKTFSDLTSFKTHQSTHSKPSHLCTQCGKVYKFSVSKHRCKPEPSEMMLDGGQNPDYLQQPQEILTTQSMPPPFSATSSDMMHQASMAPEIIPSHVSDALPVSSLSSLSLTQSISLPLTLQHVPQTIVQGRAVQPVLQHLPHTMIQTLPSQQQFNMNALNLIGESHHQSYNMDDPTRPVRHSFGSNPADTVVLQEPQHYNYIILYDRPMQQQ